jgi:hypothetical protein
MPADSLARKIGRTKDLSGATPVAGRRQTRVRYRRSYVGRPDAADRERP